MAATAHYKKPGKDTAVFNAIVAGLTRMGIGVAGSRVLAVPGRKSGEWRTTPVNPMPYQGERYLVAARGHTQWVRNLRVSGTGELRIGRRVETFTAVEVADADKPELLREYLRRWGFEVGAFFEGVNAKAPLADIQRIAPKHPIFRITTTK